MIKKISLVAIGLFIATSVFAMDGGMLGATAGSMNGQVGSYDTLGRRYPEGLPSGLTFYKNYENSTLDPKSLYADYSIGSPVATFTRTNDATHIATYIDDNGVIKLLGADDSNVPRPNKNYYDATGFHAKRGLMIEAQGTNLVPKSNTIDDATWTETNTVAANADAGSSSPDGTATAPSLTASAANGTLILTTAVTAQTYSVWLKRKTGTGTIQISGDGTNFTTVTVTSSWCRFSDTRASASQKCGIKIVTDTDAVYVYGNQYEANPYPTSFIPTTTAAATRNGETLKYAISGNRTAAQETIAIKVQTTGITAANRYLSTTDTKERRFIYYSGASYMYGNQTDSAGSVATDPASTLVANTSYVITGSVQHSNPYANVYVNGSSKNTDAVDDFTNPAWGNYFYIGGSSTSGSNHIIQSVSIFNRVLSAAEVLATSDLMGHD